MSASLCYVQSIATYNNSSKNEVFLKAYERNPKIFWYSQGFLEFLTYGGANDFGLPNLERLLGCGIQWKEQEHKRDKRLRYYPYGCGDTCSCGRCSSAKTRQRAFHGLEVFTELIKAVSNNGIKLECKGLEIELTIPIWLSELFCNPSNRLFLRQYIDRFFRVGNRAIQRWFNAIQLKGKVSGVNVLHFWKSGAPWKPHVHLHFLLAPVYRDEEGNLKPIPKWYKNEELDLLRSIWHKKLQNEFGGIDEVLNVHVNYLGGIEKTKKEERGKAKKAHSLEFRLEYMFRPPMQDFAKCIKKYLGNGMFEVSMIPEGAKDNKERIKGIVPYSELRNFIDLQDAFSIGNLKEKIPQWKLERKAKEMEQKTTLSYTIKKRKEKAKEIGESVKENNPKLYKKITKKMSRRNRTGRGHLERVRWFGFLAKRNIGEFFESLNIVKEKVESEWEDTGRQLEFLKKTENGVELIDKETGEIIEIPSLLTSDKPLNIGGKKWVWKYCSKGSSP